MASNIIMVCPFFTVSPTFTFMSSITPGSGDLTPDFPVDCAAGFTTGVVGAAGEFGNGRTTGFAGAAFGCFSISTL